MYVDYIYVDVVRKKIYVDTFDQMIKGLHVSNFYFESPVDV